jgi:taurine dioxygenase
MVEKLKERLFAHRVLVLPGQRLSPEHYQRFMELFGNPVHHVLRDLTVQGFPAILKISDYVRQDGSPYGVLDGGSYWHSDMAYLPGLGIATSLYAVRASPRSGGTAFLDLVRGWQLLRSDPKMLRLLGCRGAEEALALGVVHRFGNRRALRDPSAAQQSLSEQQRRALTDTRHRLVERHPVTGVPSLFAISGSAMELAEDPRGEILDRFEEMLLPGLVPYTHRYEPGDLVIWDNMSTLHRGVEVEPTRDFEECRLLYRINVRYCEGAA